MDFLPGGPEISLEILFRDVVLRSFIEVLPTDLAMDLAQVLLIGAWQACGPRDYVSKFDLTHKPPLTHCLGSLAGIISAIKAWLLGLGSTSASFFFFFQQTFLEFSNPSKHFMETGDHDLRWPRPCLRLRPNSKMSGGGMLQASGGFLWHMRT